MNDETLFDAAKAQRDDGMERAAAHPVEEWKAQVRAAIRRLAARETPFISDDVWEELGPELTALAAELGMQRSLGPLIMEARRDGVIEKTGRSRPSVRSNLSPKPEWVGGAGVNATKERCDLADELREMTEQVSDYCRELGDAERLNRAAAMIDPRSNR